MHCCAVNCHSWEVEKIEVNGCNGNVDCEVLVAKGGSVGEQNRRIAVGIGLLELCLNSLRVRGSKPGCGICELQD